MLKSLRQLLPGGRFGDVCPARAATMRAVRSFNNRSTETRLRMALVCSGVRGWRIRPAHTEGNPDFVFASAKVAVFADGCFWHGCVDCPHNPIRSNAQYWKRKIAHNREKDARISGHLKSGGWLVLRFWEHEIRDLLPKVVARIQIEVASRSAESARKKGHASRAQGLPRAVP
jgi:DNA mismatch endonuclease (patch repair protein)